MRRSRKDNLVAAATALIAERGVDGTTMRAIAQAAGLTEGAIYRHFPSKAELVRVIYESAVTELVDAKEVLVARKLSFPETIREWVRITYLFFDNQPDAFTFVLLVPHAPDAFDSDITARQGLIFLRLFESARERGEAASLPADLAMSHFTGLMLNVPRLINEGVLTRPASLYTDDVADAILRVLLPSPPGGKID